MASKTTNYGLNKHSPQDFYNVEARNENWDKIDEALAATDPTKVTAKAEPADGDGVMIADSADGGKAKRLLWSNVKAALGKLFVPLTRKVNGKVLTEDVTLTGENIAVSTTDSTPISGAVKYRRNPNLLDNWYFGRPVNQRGQTELASGNWNMYFIDRWMAASSECAYAITDDGIKISKLPHKYQQIWLQKMERMEKRTYTLSFLLKNIGLLSMTFTPSGSDYTEQTLDGGFIVSFTSDDNLANPAIRLLDSTSVTVSDVTLLAAKLELGDTQTLAHKENGVWVLNEVPDYREQLRRCEFYRRVSTAGHYFSGGMYSCSNGVFLFPFSGGMRVTPSIEIVYPGSLQDSNGTSHDLSADNYSIEGADQFGAKIVLHGLSGIPAGPAHIVDAKFALSADL